MEEPHSSVSIWDVNGVRFLGCTFTNQPLDFPHSGNAIYALSGQFRVDEFAPSPSTTLPTSFAGYNYGIKAFNVCRADKFTILANSTYMNNKHGIYLNTQANARVVKNIITIPDIPVSNIEPPLYGLYFDECTGYNFAQNSVTGIGGSNFPKVGAVFHNNVEGMPIAPIKILSII